jgi:phosphoribosylformimino-5-aminoimidazole carboxamide ribotide isomerase
MLIPAIDLKGGKVVQLIQGEKLAIETTDLDHWIERFAGFKRVNVIDLDAAMGSGSNDHLVREICARLPCQVGGGVRSPERAVELCAIGARKVIIGSALFKDESPTPQAHNDFLTPSASSVWSAPSTAKVAGS